MGRAQRVVGIVALVVGTAGCVGGQWMIMPWLLCVLFTVVLLPVQACDDTPMQRACVDGRWVRLECDTGASCNYGLAARDCGGGLCVNAPLVCLNGGPAGYGGIGGYGAIGGSSGNAGGGGDGGDGGQDAETDASLETMDCDDAGSISLPADAGSCVWR